MKHLNELLSKYEDEAVNAKYDSARIAARIQVQQLKAAIAADWADLEKLRKEMETKKIGYADYAVDLNILDSKAEGMYRGMKEAYDMLTDYLEGESPDPYVFKSGDFCTTKQSTGGAFSGVLMVIDVDYRFQGTKKPGVARLIAENGLDTLTISTNEIEKADDPMTEGWRP
jgi:hypothetical protein